MESKLKALSVKVKGFKFQVTLQMTFCKEIVNCERKHSPPISFNSKTKTVANDVDIDSSLKTSCQTNNFFKNSRWIIESIDSQYFTQSTSRKLIHNCLKN